ncbi:MAG: FecR domain-containing protein [Burkholderiales bacterium]|nr:FecR domain-containing protein [Burkholderiales bacterium]
MQCFRLIRALISIGVLTWMPLQAYAATAGKVLLASGEVIAVRDGRDVRLAAGDAIHDRDTLSTGAASNLQVRLTDESIISLRERSQLRIDEYRFAGKDGGKESAFFRLLKGGFRTVTGLIGRVNHRDYAVTTASATIGIRGTMYALAQCQQDCRNSDGSLAADGVYGSVLGPSRGTNQLTAVNNAGESVIGINQHFHVADMNSAPALMLEPPSFVLDRLSGAKPSGAPSSAPAASSGIAADSRPNTLPDPMTQVNLNTVQGGFVATQSLQPGGLSAALTVNQAQVQFQPVGSPGDIRGQLVWLTNADMDLHLNTPNGAHVYYGNSNVTLPGGATAALDADNVGGDINVQPNQRIENIRVSGPTPPVGTYSFYVHAYSRGDTTTSVLTVTGDGGATGRTHNVPALPNRGTSQNYQVIFNGPGVQPGYNP